MSASTVFEFWVSGLELAKAGGFWLLVPVFSSAVFEVSKLPNQSNLDFSRRSSSRTFSV